LIQSYRLFNFFACPCYYFEAVVHYPDHLIAGRGFQPAVLFAGCPDIDPVPGFPEMFFVPVVDVEVVVAEHHCSLYQVCCSVFHFPEMFFVPVADVEAVVAAHHYFLYQACCSVFHFPGMSYVPVAGVEAAVAAHHYSLHPVCYSFSADLLFHFPALLLEENFFFLLFLNYL